MLATRKIRGKN